MIVKSHGINSQRVNIVSEEVLTSAGSASVMTSSMANNVNAMPMMWICRKVIGTASLEMTLRSAQGGVSAGQYC